MNDIHGLWLHLSVDPFANYDPFRCLDLSLTGEMDCGFCVHCGIDARYEIREDEKNSLWIFCSLNPFICYVRKIKNYVRCFYEI